MADQLADLHQGEFVKRRALSRADITGKKTPGVGTHTGHTGTHSTGRISP